MTTVRTVCRKLKVKGSVIRLETSDPGSNDYHPHIHGLIDSPSGGRSFISPANWQDAWLTALPQWLHPTVGGVHIKPVRDLEAACAYMTKSAFSSYRDGYDLDDISRTLAAIECNKGVQQFSVRGSLAA